MTSLADFRAAKMLLPMAGDSQRPAVRQRWFCKVPTNINGRTVAFKKLAGFESEFATIFILECLLAL